MKPVERPEMATEQQFRAIFSWWNDLDITAKQVMGESDFRLWLERYYGVSTLKFLTRQKAREVYKIVFRTHRHYQAASRKFPISLQDVMSEFMVNSPEAREAAMQIAVKVADTVKWIEIMDEAYTFASYEKTVVFPETLCRAWGKVNAETELLQNVLGRSNDLQAHRRINPKPFNASKALSKRFKEGVGGASHGR